MGKFTARVVAEIEVVTVVVVSDTRDTEELPEPVYHVTNHSSLKF